MPERRKVLTVLFAVFAAVLTICLARWTNHTLMRKTSENRMQDLIEGKTNKDILFVGTSHVMDAVIPMELWERYGYTSYILCAEYNDMERNVAMVRLALQYTEPELIVLDIDNYWEKSPEDKTLIGYHEFADAFPLTWEKYRTTRLLYGGNKSAGREILFPFLLYHNRWNDLSRNDFRTEVSENFWRGYEFATDSKEVEMIEPVPRSEAVLPDVYGVAAIERFIEECQGRGIDVMLMTAPFGANAQEQQYLQGIYEIAEKYGVPYVNMLEDESIVNARTDYRDEGHLNISGAVKVTDYIGGYISDSYTIPDRRADGAYGEWQEDYAQYRGHVQETMQESADLEQLLILCGSGMTDISVWIRADCGLAEDAHIRELLQNAVSFETAQILSRQEKDYMRLGREGDAGILERFEMGDIYIAVYDKGNGALICEKAFRQEESAPVLAPCERTENKKE